MSDWIIERHVIESNTQDVLDQREKMIENLQNELKVAGEVCTSLSNGNASLREERDQLQEQCSLLLDKQVQDDYKVENAKKIVENLKKTIERFKEENEALRVLLRLWM